jgi:4,5-dihydroxyphthalate decarboxylase
VDVSSFRWVIAADDVFPLYDAGTRLERAADPRKGPVQQLLDGDVDAIVTDISDATQFRQLETSPQVKRLFPDYLAEDLALYRDTGTYTPVHVMVLSKQLDRAHPELAGQLCQAFEQAKALAYDDILSDRAGFSVVYLSERLLEQQREWGDPWRYGREANRRTIEDFARYNQEQGMTRARLAPEQAFAASTLNT